MATTLTHCDLVIETLDLMGPLDADQLLRAAGNGITRRELAAACWALLEAEEVTVDQARTPNVWALPE